MVKGLKQKEPYGIAEGLDLVKKDSGSKNRDAEDNAEDHMLLITVIQRNT